MVVCGCEPWAVTCGRTVRKLVLPPGTKVRTVYARNGAGGRCWGTSGASESLVYSVRADQGGLGRGPINSNNNRVTFAI